MPIIVRARKMIDVRLRVDPDDGVRGAADRACCSDANWPAPVGAVGRRGRGGCAREYDPVWSLSWSAGAGAGAGAAAAPCGIVSLPARQAATNARFVCPEALIAALFAAYSASHWLAVFIAAAGAGAGLQARAPRGQGAAAPVFS